MGKASKWIRALFGLKRSDPNPDLAQKPPAKKKWSFAKSRKEKDLQQQSQHGAARGGYNDNEASKHAIFVAAATAAVAEAAVRTAQAAAAAVKLTSRPVRNTSTAERGGDSNSVARVSQNGASYGSREEWAAVTIQSHFRAYLSRRALRALKALVKIQALVRGHISRKQAADNLRRMQALVRAQARARAGRVLISEAQHSTTKSSHLNHTVRTSERSWEQGSSFTRLITTDDDERSDKILEVDPGKPHVTPKNRIISHSCQLTNRISDQYSRSLSTSNHTNVQSPSSGEVVQSVRRLRFGQDADEISSFLTAENSPLFYSASSTGRSSKRAPFTPTKSDGASRSCLSGYYVDHPNYMAYTESSKAKVRSLSAPKQRPQYERSSSMSRYSVHGYGDSRINTQKASSSALHANFTTKAYPGSGCLDRLGMPVRGDVSGFSGGHWQRY